jgi:transcription initiation factor TFIID subunit 1
MSFQKLFKKADEVSGLSAPFPLEQADTSAFDVEEDEQGNKPTRVVPAVREVDKLHTLVSRVILRPEPENKVIRRSDSRKISRANPTSAGSVKLHIVPDFSWEADVERAMNDVSSGDDQLHDKVRRSARDDANRTVPSLAENMSIVRGHIHDMSSMTPFVNLDEDPDVDGWEEDPLDVLIPNRTTGTYMKIVPEGSSSEPESKTAPLGMAPASHPSAKATMVTASETDLIIPEPIDRSLMSKAERDKQRKLEKAMRIKGVDINFDAAASIERSANLRPRDNLPQYRSRANRSLIAALNHCNIATSHKNTKADLYEVELKYFHRPRMIRERDRAWQVIPKSIFQKSKSASKSGVSGSGLAQTPATGFSGAKLAADVDKQNLSLAGAHAEFILLEYVEEFPPVVLNYGMASAMFNYYRSPEQNEEEDEGKTKARVESNKLVESVLGDRTRSRLPRHLMLLLQLRNVKQTYDHDVNVPRLKQGETKVLSGEDDSPFLGKIDEGEIQQSFTNNLFRAPIFKHTPHPTDFILIRTKITANLMTYVMREIPCLYLCGQLEPQKIVPRPVPMITQLQEKFYLLAAVRYLQAHFDGADFDDLERNILKYCLKAQASPHKAQHRQKLKAIVRKVGDEVRDMMAGTKWYCKDFAERAADADEAADLERRFSPEEVARSFTPEEVCLQESANAAEYRLFQQHIVDVDLSKVEMWLTHTHRVKQLQMDRAEKAKRLANDCRTTHPALSQTIEQFISVLIRQIRRTDAKLAVGRFIFDRLVSAPWNTTEAYVRSHLERDGQGKLELQGVGDPSGRGEGFSFVRIVRSARAPGPAVKKNTVKYFATDSDLRKLTKKDAVRLLVALGVREAEAMALKRWDRVHMIREFSTKLEKTGLAKELHKYARSGAESNTTSAGESFHVIAQEIWNRQKAALSSTSLVRATSGVINPPATATATAGAGGEPSSAPGASASSSSAAVAKGVTSQDAEQEESDSESDEDFAESIARSLAARAAASAVADAQTRDKNSVEEEKKELSNMSTFFSSLDKAPGGSGTTGASSSSGAQLTAGAGGNSGFAASVSKLGDNAAALKKRKVHVGISGLSQGAATDEATVEGAEPLTLSLSVPVAATSVTAVVGGATASTPFVDDWVRPRRVVKRVTRSVLSDGTESIKVEFVVQESEVDRVDRSSARWRKDRELRRSATAAGGYTNALGNAEEGEDDNDDAVPATLGSMKINLSRMKKVVDQGNLVIKRERADMDADDMYYGGSAGAGVGGGKGGQKSSKRSAEIVINTRVPRVSLAARLEEELMKLWNSKHSPAFLYPVNAMAVPGYYQRITDPICLTDIRDKVVSYQYERASAMQEDVDKMARNAEIFNGPAHAVTLAGKKLANMLQINLRHDREHLGAEHDQISYIEEAIQRKKVYLKKNHLSPADTNPLIPPPSK